MPPQQMIRIDRRSRLTETSNRFLIPAIPRWGVAGVVYSYRNQVSLITKLLQFQ
jgi:hypothetical protein